MTHRPAAGRDAPPRARNRTTILYVEDDDDNLVLVRKRLETDYELLTAKNDKEACQKYRSHHNEIDCVLLDVQLQGSKLDGIGLARLFRGHPLPQGAPPYAADMPTTNVPVIFLTAHAGQLTERDVGDIGNTDVLAKPIQFVRLNTLLSQIHLRRAASAIGRL